MTVQRDTVPKAMETSDLEMEAAEAAREIAAGTSRQMENAWGLLSRARQLLAEGSPTLALQSVIFLFSCSTLAISIRSLNYSS